MKFGETKNGWRKYKTSKMVYKFAECFYQKELFRNMDGDKIFANICEHDYTDFPQMKQKKSYDIKIQIPEELSIAKITINVNLFSYTKLDFKKMEKDARKVIKLLTNQPKG